MIIRPTTETDLGPVLACRAADPVSLVPPDRYRADLASFHYRPEWTWIAEDGRAILARAVWWGYESAAYPLALDCLHVSDAVPNWADLAAALIRAGHEAFRRAGAPQPPRYELRLPTAWRASPDTTQAVRWRREAAARAGLTDELERIRFEWTPAAGLPRSSGRLVFRPEPDDEAFIDVFRQVADGSLDVTTRRDVAAVGAGRQAREDFGLYRDMPGSRDWWRLAYTADGQLAGMILPNRNPYGAVVGYLGVLPGMRGRGYIHNLLAETTRFHAARGEPRITATTDTTNQPMAAAFRRAGYQETGIRYVFSAPAQLVG
jgi:ribosomal protein S18 acetylase RimI-like enzyme